MHHVSYAKKLIICFSGTARVISTHGIKTFYCISTNKCEKSSTHRKLSVQFDRHLPCLQLCMVGWLDEFWCTCSRDLAPFIKLNVMSR